MPSGRRVSVSLIAALLPGAIGYAQLGSEPIDPAHPAIAYSAPATRNPVAALNSRLADGRARLAFDERTGYLRSVLAELDIPIESQIVVFSGASLQGRLITPSNPRSIFFNDSVAVAWVRGGFIEIAAHDIERGAVFYQLQQAPGAPQAFRDNRCLSCHYSATTMGVPGFIARSIPAATDGTIMPWLGNYLVDHRTPMADRWGGWYVTGRAGSTAHLGNAPLSDKRLPELRPADSGPVLSTLQGRFDTSGYLSPHSDVVALLVFEHQAHMMNLLSRIGADARVLAGSREATARLREAAMEVVDYLLFVDEAPLSGVSGTSGFAKVFSARGPRDSKGRSLRDLDLGRRLMRYPCSYMIYSDAFNGLPEAAKQAIGARLRSVLAGGVKDARHARLSAEDRRAVLDILRATKPGLLE